MLHSIDRSGRLVHVSNYWLAKMGYKREDILGRRFVEFLTEESRHYAEKVILPAFFKNGYCKNVPYQLVEKSGRILDVLLTATPTRNERGEADHSLAVLVDVTQQKRVKDALRRKIQSTKALLNAIPDMIFRITKDGVYKEFKPGKTFRPYAPPSEFLGKRIADVMPKAVAQKSMQSIKHALQTGTVQGIQYRLSADGLIHDYEARIIPTRADEVMAIVRDVTQEKQVEDELKHLAETRQALNTKILKTQEAERKRISQELHDELGQLLTVLKMDADRLTALDPAHQKELALQFCQRLDDAIQLVRTVAYQLRPAALEHLGLGPTLEILVERLLRRSKLPCEIYVSPKLQNVPEEAAVAIYRIAQEALTNSLLHAKAHRIKLTLRRSDRCILLTVEDNGVGIPLSVLRNARSLGLIGMQERANQLGGKLTINRRRGGGTVVTARIPYVKPTKQKRNWRGSTMRTGSGKRTRIR